MRLKRARLADDLNEKIAQRPGPMELVEKNILPVDSGVEEDIDGRYSSTLSSVPQGLKPFKMLVLAHFGSFPTNSSTVMARELTQASIAAH